MSWHYIAASVAAGLALAGLLAVTTLRWARRREPYRSFLHLPVRGKLTFFAALLRDRRVPFYLKLLPLVVIAYVASPLDLMPGIVLDDVAVALFGLMLLIKLTPQPALEDALRRAQGGGNSASCGGRTQASNAGPAGEH